MAQETVEIIIDENGEIKITAKGILGAKCKEITAPIERALGSKIKDVDTEEMRGGKIQNVNRSNA